MIKGVLFDMDGILFNTEHLSATADVKTQAHMQITMPEDMHRQFIGGSDESAAELISAHFNGEVDGNEFIRIFHEFWAKEVEENLETMPGAREAIAWLKENGYKIAIASSSTVAHIQRNIKMTGLDGLFDAIVGGDMVENGKPAPDIFIKAAGALGFKPAECAAVEDSYNGVRSAHGAGCQTIMVPDILPPTDEMHKLCRGILKSLHDLPAFLQEL